MDVTELILEREAQIRKLQHEIDILKFDGIQALFQIPLSNYENELDTKLYYVLLRAGYTTLGDVLGKSKDELLKLYNFGPKKLEKLEHWVAEKHFEFFSISD